MNNLFSKINWNEIKQKLKKIKKLEIIFGIIILVIVLVIYFSSISKTKNSQTALSAISMTASDDYAYYLENKLSQVLSNINGAGKVTALVTLEGSSEKSIASKNEEKVNSTSSGTNETSSSTTSTTPIITSSSGSSTPLILYEKLPVVKGVIVVAEGANDLNVRLALMKAIKALLDVDSNNIEIFIGK